MTADREHPDSLDAIVDPGAGIRDGVLDTPARLARVEGLVRRPPVTCAPSTSIRDAAALMAQERISSLLIPHSEGPGILTDRDLRGKVVALGRDVAGPISDVMTARARTIPGSAMVGEAVLAMLEGGFHHLPVTDPAGGVLGVVTDTDLIGLGRDSPSFSNGRSRTRRTRRVRSPSRPTFPESSARWWTQASSPWTSGTPWR